jgi:hypothetical protein
VPARGGRTGRWAPRRPQRGPRDGRMDRIVCRPPDSAPAVMGRVELVAVVATRIGGAAAGCPVVRASGTGRRPCASPRRGRRPWSPPTRRGA